METFETKRKFKMISLEKAEKAVMANYKTAINHRWRCIITGKFKTELI